MSLFQGAHDIVAAKTNKALDSAENPNEMLDYSYQQMLDHITTAPEVTSGSPPAATPTAGHCPKGRHGRMSSELPGTRTPPQAMSGHVAMLRSLGWPNSVTRQFDFWDDRYEGRRLFSEALGTFFLVLV